MSAEFVVQLGQVGTLAVASVGIGVALVNHHRQQNAQMFIEFSKRFQELLRLFPTEAWLANRNPSQPMPPSSPTLTDCTLYTMQLVADVYYLRNSGYVSKKLWMLWEREIRHTITGPVFRREWEVVAAEFTSNPAFLQYVNALMRAKRPMATDANP